MIVINFTNVNIASEELSIAVLKTIDISECRFKAGQVKAKL
jgi:hypothetical protein